MSDLTGTDAAKPATVFVTTAADVPREDPTGTDTAAPAIRCVVSAAGEGDIRPPQSTAGVPVCARASAMIVE
jgi:hypothetical protein